MLVTWIPGTEKLQTAGEERHLCRVVSHDLKVLKQSVKVVNTANSA